MIKDSEKLYITEHYVGWKPGKFRYWEALPKPTDAGYEASKDKPALVFIHGYAAMIEHWRYALAGLKGKYRMYALDLLGFGFSEKLSGDKVHYSADLWARQVRDLLIHKGEKKAILIGHSMGGMVGIQFSRNYPDMASGLVLVDSSGLPDQGQVEKEGMAQGKRRGLIDFGELTYNAIKAPGLGELAAFAISATEWAVRSGLKQAYWDTNKVTPELVEQFRAPLRIPGGPQAYLAVTRNFAEYQLDLKPGDLSLPTFIIWGEHDRSMKPEIVLPRWQKLFPHAGVYVVKDAAHCPQDEKPEEVNTQIEQFVEKLVSSRVAVA
jgi:pimeloyl-ACP methyl ester carboxylesterase